MGDEEERQNSFPFFWPEHLGRGRAASVPIMGHRQLVVKEEGRPEQWRPPDTLIPRRPSQQAAGVGFWLRNRCQLETRWAQQGGMFKPWAGKGFPPRGWQQAPALDHGTATSVTTPKSVTCQLPELGVPSENRRRSPLGRTLHLAASGSFPPDWERRSQPHNFTS